MNQAGSSTMVRSINDNQKNILITGAAKRVGAHCVRYLHAQGANILLHYRSSSAAAQELADNLNQQRPDSVRIFQADLLDMQELQLLTDFAKQAWGGIDVLVNNASAFYATDLTEVTEDQWDELLGSNLKSPFSNSGTFPNIKRANRGAL